MWSPTHAPPLGSWRNTSAGASRSPGAMPAVAAEQRDHDHLPIREGQHQESATFVCLGTPDELLLSLAREPAARMRPFNINEMKEYVLILLAMIAGLGRSLTISMDTVSTVFRLRK